MYFNILKIPFYDNDRMCHSYVYSIHPHEIFKTKTMREKYNLLYNITRNQNIKQVSGFHQYTPKCYYLLCTPSEYVDHTQKLPAKNDDILYIYDFLSKNGYIIQTKESNKSFEGYHIGKHFGEIIATFYKP